MTVVLITHDDTLGQRPIGLCGSQDGRLKSDTRTRAGPPAAARQPTAPLAIAVPSVTSVPVSNLGNGTRPPAGPRACCRPSRCREGTRD